MTSSAPAALPETCYPTVWLWPGQALYAGPGLNLDPHSGSVWCLAVGVDRPLVVTTDGHRVAGHSVLIPPRLRHHLDTRGGRLVSCYLDPTSDRADACHAACADTSGPVAVGHRAEAALAIPPGDDGSAADWLDLAAPASAEGLDPRIAAATAAVRDDPSAAIPSRVLAAAAGLSESRFLHLFRAEVGTSLRRYRLWVRLIHAGNAIGAGHSLTDAAASAGFASPSHLSDSFKATFGLTASRLIAAGLTVRTP